MRFAAGLIFCKFYVKLVLIFLDFFAKFPFCTVFLSGIFQPVRNFSREMKWVLIFGPSSIFQASFEPPKTLTVYDKNLWIWPINSRRLVEPLEAQMDGSNREVNFFCINFH